MSETESPGRIVPFTAAMIEPGSALLRAVFNAPPWNNRWTETNAREHLRDIVESAGYIGYAVVEDGDEPVAFAVGDTEHWSDRVLFYLKELCVRADRQRHGIATRLLTHLEADLRARGVASLYLLTIEGPPAEPFYRHKGFKPIEHMILMSHRL